MRQVLWKESLLYFGGQQLVGEGGLLSKGHLLLTGNQWARTFTDGGRGPIYKNSAVSSDSHLKTGHAMVWSVSSWLFKLRFIFSSSINFFLFLWGQPSELWQLTVIVTVTLLHCYNYMVGSPVVNFFHLDRVLASIRQHIRHGSEYYLYPLKSN